MKFIALTILAGLFFQATAVTSDTRPLVTPAFPGAEGFGTTTAGGRGGPAMAVTHLTDEGPGSRGEERSRGSLLGNLVDRRGFVTCRRCLKRHRAMVSDCRRSESQQAYKGTARLRVALARERSGNLASQLMGAQRLSQPASG